MIDPATFTRMHKLNVLAGTSVNEAMRNIFVFFANLLNFSNLQIVYGFTYPLGLKIVIHKFPHFPGTLRINGDMGVLLSFSFYHPSFRCFPQFSTP